MRMATVWDEIDDNGMPVIAAGHPRVGPEEQRQFLDYLSAATVLMRTPSLAQDVADPGKGQCVPQYFATDGDFVWDGALVYYLKTYALSPDPEFVAYLRERVPGRPEAVDEEHVQRALAFMRG